MKTAIALLRVSTEDQHNGIDVQRAAIEAWSALNGVQVLAYHEEHVSGASQLSDRYGLLAAIADVGEKRADILVAHKRDRIARDPMVSILTEREVAKVGARLCTVEGGMDGDGPQDRFMRRILDAVAELEREMIVARTKAALAAKKARGERTGSVPVGKRVDGGVLVDDEGEQRAIALARRLRSEGYSLRDIGVELQLAGFATRKGGAFAPEQVKRLVS